MTGLAVGFAMMAGIAAAAGAQETGPSFFVGNLVGEITEIVVTYQCGNETVRHKIECIRAKEGYRFDVELRNSTIEEAEYFYLKVRVDRRWLRSGRIRADFSRGTPTLYISAEEIDEDMICKLETATGGTILTATRTASTVVATKATAAKTIVAITAEEKIMAKIAALSKIVFAAGPVGCVTARGITLLNLWVQVVYYN